MNKLFVTARVIRFCAHALLPGALCAALGVMAFGQTPAPAAGAEGRTQTDQKRLSSSANTPNVAARAEATKAAPESGAGASESNDAFFGPIYHNFYNTYRLGPGDVLSLRVTQQPDYTVEHAKVSPTGRVYHPLLGDFEVAGLTVGQVLDRFKKDLAEYLVDPKVSVELVEANSAKIGVLGEVKAPGVVVMTRPMTVMDAIAAVGGFTDTGSKSNVTLLRPTGGRLVETKINVKRLLDGKSSLEEDLSLRAGDTLIVRGNAKKKFAEITSLIGFAQFVTFLGRY
jgi:polysaccharide export outer membrane protein